MDLSHRRWCIEGSGFEDGLYSTHLLAVQALLETLWLGASQVWNAGSDLSAQVQRKLR
jgi:hypothetical protein